MKTLKQVKRIIVAVIGGTILLFGVMLLVLPGPGTLVIVIGLGILATEFAWAKRWMKKVKSLIPKNNSGADTKKNHAALHHTATKAD